MARAPPTVKDPKDAAVANVNLILTNQDTGIALSTKSDAVGNYESHSSSRASIR